MPAPGDQHRDTKASINPFEELVPHISEYTAQEIATLQSRLDKQLGPEYISTRPGAGGGKVHYLAAEKLINLANEVFGFNGWSSTIRDVQIDFVDESPSTQKITLGLSVIMRVTLRDGTYHEDIGYGHIENCKGKAAAFEKAKKEATTDALKRALRNFGNVLGNCLYDKDYLQRILKVKAGPSKWDAENLHRHHDFAPIKKESIAEAEAARLNRAQRMTSGQSALSNGTTEYGEDEFGGNLFDEVDFSHPDEVHLDASITDTSVVEPQANGGPPRQAMNRVSSMPTMRQPNGNTGAQPPQQIQPPPRPSGPNPPNNNASHRPDQAPGRPMPPMTNGMQRQQQGQQVQPHQQQQRPPPQQPLPQPHPPQQGNAQQQGQPQNGDRAKTPSSAGDGTHEPELPPTDPQVGFVTGRAAAGGPVQRFNPHAESPSIRRTVGVNPGKSEPIKRQNLGSVVPAVDERPSGPPSGPPSRVPSPAPANRTNNFVNPAADMTRRIGAPGGNMSPLGNRNAYKPPTAVKRPAPSETGNARSPLADMSNMQQLDGSNDAKKVKLDGPQQGQAPKQQINAPVQSS